MGKKGALNSKSEIVERVASEIAEIVRMALNSFLEKSETEV